MVAIVDDDESVRSALQGLMKSVGLPARAFASAEEFLASGEQGETGCLISDIRMPGMSGLELQTALKVGGWSVPIIFITAYADETVRRRALKAGALELLAKPFDEDALIASIRRVLEN